MTDDRRSKAQLLEEIQTLKTALAAVPEKAERPASVPEADALAECIRAINRLPRLRRDSGTVTYTFVASGEYGYDRSGIDTATIRRILTHLADKFGVPERRNTGGSDG